MEEHFCLLKTFSVNTYPHTPFAEKWLPQYKNKNISPTSQFIMDFIFWNPFPQNEIQTLHPYTNSYNKSIRNNKSQLPSMHNDVPRKAFLSAPITTLAAKCSHHLTPIHCTTLPLNILARTFMILLISDYIGKDISVIINFWWSAGSNYLKPIIPIELVRIWWQLGRILKDNFNFYKNLKFD